MSLIYQNKIVRKKIHERSVELGEEVSLNIAIDIAKAFLAGLL